MRQTLVKNCRIVWRKDPFRYAAGCAVRPTGAWLFVYKLCFISFIKVLIGFYRPWAARWCGGVAGRPMDGQKNLMDGAIKIETTETMVFLCFATFPIKDHGLPCVLLCFLIKIYTTKILHFRYVEFSFFIAIRFNCFFLCNFYQICWRIAARCLVGAVMNGRQLCAFTFFALRVTPPTQHQILVKKMLQNRSEWNSKRIKSSNIKYPGTQNVHEFLKAPGASELRGRFGFQDARPAKGIKFKTNQVK